MTDTTKKRWFFFLLVIPLAVIILYFSRGVITPFILSFFIAYALNPMVEFFQKKGAPRDWAIITVYLIVFLMGALLVQLLIPRLINDLVKVIHRLPDIIDDIQSVEAKIVRFFKDWQIPMDWRAINAELSKRSEAALKGLLAASGAMIIQIFSRSAIYVLVPLIAYYISRDYPRLKKRSLSWIQFHLGNYWTKTFLKVDGVFRLYIRGQVLDTLIVGLLLGCGLSVLGFEAAFFLGLLAGIFNLIPYFGPVLGAFPAILLALWKSPWMVFYVILLFLVVNQIEVMFLAPRIMGSTLGLHPLTVIFLILTGGAIFGLLGMIFAVPIGTIVIIMVQSIYERCFANEID